MRYWLCSRGGTPWGRLGGALPVKTKIKQSEVATTKSEIPQLLQGLGGDGLTVTHGATAKREGQQLRDTEGHARKWGDRKHVPHIQAVSVSEDSMPEQKHCPSPTPEGHTAVSTRDIRNNLCPQNRRKARQCEERDRPRHRWVLARSTKPQFARPT